MWFFVFILVYLHTVTAIYATDFILSEVPVSKASHESFAVSVFFSGSKSSCANKSYYIRPAFYLDGSKNYFGYIENNQGVWISDPESIQDYYQFTTSEEGSWSGIINIKAATETLSEYSSNDYLLKLGRYTETGTSVAEWSNSEPIKLNFPLPPTPVPTPIPTPKPTSTPTPTPQITPTPVPITPRPTQSPTPTIYVPTPHPSAEPVVLADDPPDEGSVAGILSETATAKVEAKQSKAIPIVITVGGLLIMAGILPLGFKMIGDT